MDGDRLAQRIEDLKRAIALTQVAYENASSPVYKDLHLVAIGYYKSELKKAEELTHFQTLNRGSGKLGSK
jgi:hypothetical protein